MYKTDLERPTKEILEDVRKAALQSTATSELKMGIIAVPIATLLVKLSQEAEQTAQTIRRFTKWLVGLTFALFFLTVALLSMQAYQVYDNYRFNHERAQSGSQIQEEQSNPPD